MLVKMLPYEFPYWWDIVAACMTTHNFLHRVSLDDELFLKAGQEEDTANVYEETNNEIHDQETTDSTKS